MLKLNLISLKDLFRQRCPAFVALVGNILKWPLWLFIKVTIRRFHGPEYLSSSELEKLVVQFRRSKFSEIYDTTCSGDATRGVDRLAQIKTLLGKRFKQVHHCLELGAGSGSTSLVFERAGKKCVAIDTSDRAVDQNIRTSGVQFHQMSADQLQFQDQSFDLVFSYDAFEHFQNPQAVLEEATRVTKPGGYIYLNFGPLYESSKGLHGYLSVPIPYAQFLFTPETLHAFTNRHKLQPIDFDFVNKWSLFQYRMLWQDFESRLKIIDYKEFPDLFYKRVIFSHPSCFKKVSDPESLLVSFIEVLFERRS